MEWDAEIAGKILFSLFLTFSGVQVFYYLFFFSRLAFYRRKNTTQSEKPVSVIICARNEAANLRNHLHSVLNQDHKNYQVVVVNDCSWDETGNCLEEFADAYPNLKIVTIKEQERYRYGKKFALTLGIKAAANEILLLTDADCEPAGKNWVSEMTKNISEEKQIVIGYGAYKKLPGLLNKWIRMDTVFNAIQYLSFAAAGCPYMGVGRNLCYTKSLFFKHKGFASHNHILSGDDDLFINEAASGKNVSVEISPDAFTFSLPKTTFMQWIRQKKRHMSTSSHYRPQHQLLLGLFYFSHILFYASLAALLILEVKPATVLNVFGLKILLQAAVFGGCLRKLKEADLWWMFPVQEAAVGIIYPILAISNLFIKNKSWK